MSLLLENPSAELGDRLREACAVTAEFMSDIVRQTCRRFPSLGQSAKTDRIERLIQSGAWTDAALALLDLELPQWQIRRVAYDQGEWYCALSRQRELPDWLDQSIELELPQWQIRRVAYDQGEWYCSLSRQRELPDWLDQPIETHHADLALAILSAFVEAQRISAQPIRTSVPTVPQDANPLFEPVYSDNFA